MAVVRALAARRAGRRRGARVPAAALGALPLAAGTFVEGDVRDVDAAAAALAAAEPACAAADLVTADGAVEMDHAHLEREHLPLLVAQVQVALRLLRPGGALVVKFFEGLTVGTAQVLAELTHRFEAVSLIKPTSSRPTNSERYAVARGRLPEAPPLETPARALVLAAPWRDHLAHHAGAMARRQAGALEGALRRVSVAPPGRGGDARTNHRGGR